MDFNRAIRAGLVGGVTVDLFLIVIRAVPFPGVYQFIASILVGPVAFTSSAYIVLGLLLHFCISIAFASAYVIGAERSPALNRTPLVWGTVFGIAVMIVMQIVTGLAHAAQPPSVAGIIIGLVAHVVFFGLPVALFVARGNRRQTLAV